MIAANENRVGDGAFGARRARVRRLLTPGHLAVIAAVALAAGLLVLLVIRLGMTNQARDRALTLERHSYEVMLATRAAGASMAKAEAALGRFAINGDRATGSAYYDDWVLAGAQIDRLAREVSRDPVETALAERLRTLYAERGRELGRPAAQAAARQGWAALASFNAAGRSPLIREIDRTLESLRTHERETLAGRYDRSEAISTDTDQAVGLLSATGLALVAAAAGLAWAVTVSWWGHRRAEDAADEADRRAEWLREAVALRTAELGAAEAQVRQMQKMDALGRLTGGIAHDFNNMLAVIVAGVDLARRRLAVYPPDAAGAGEQLDRAMDGADRAAALVRRLLGFARAEPLRPEAVAPAALVAGMSELIDRALGELVTVDTALAPDCWPVWADPLQLENALVNLAVNARDAVDGSGTITIAAANATLAAGEVGALPEGDYVRISVRDEGAGMTPEVIERVFEPFFTTKPVGKGTGLGMSQIFGFVRQSDGDVTIDSAPGRGTTVSLLLPRARTAALPVAVPQAEVATLPPPPSRERGRTVLVVEDDARVRAGTIGALEDLGYRPIACEDGESALAVLNGHPGIDVVITDVVMPGMGGLELASAIRARGSHAEILFVTGYSADEAGGLAGETLLRKPFTIARLDAEVEAAFTRAALSAPHPGPGAAAAA